MQIYNVQTGECGKKGPTGTQEGDLEMEIC